MRGRQAAWSNPRLQKLAQSFVPVADEVWFLHNRKGPECDFFRSFCEEGHYGGRQKPTSTRQGIYCAAPSGVFLASVNSTDPKRLEAMLTQALERWRELPEAERYMKDPPKAGATDRFRTDSRYPANGLVLRVYTRDLPRKNPKHRGWRAKAWNEDFAWFTADEARTFVPTRREVGARRTIDAQLAGRLARCHLVDNVFGQTRPFRKGEIKTAELTSRIERIEGTQVHVVFEGETHAAAEGSWNMGGLRFEKKKMTRGYKARLRGTAVFDTATKRFTSFELVVVGDRWGGTQYNARDDDLEPAAMGVVFVLAGDSASDRVAPAHYWSY